jgi:hypothetical protein
VKSGFMVSSPVVGAGVGAEVLVGGRGGTDFVGGFGGLLQLKGYKVRMVDEPE